MRCLTLAGMLRERKASVSFICREEEGNLITQIREYGYTVHSLNADENGWKEDADLTSEIMSREQGIYWLVVDNYALDNRWEQQLRPFVKRIMVIDDLADRPHNCDLLLDQNYYEGMETRYSTLVPQSCIKLIGPRFALLRPEFTAERMKLRKRDGSIRRLLIFFGASDRTDETGKTLEAVDFIGRPEMKTDVVIGVNNPHRTKIETQAERIPGTVCHVQVTEMAELMNVADLYVGAAGTTTWERCCLGLPSIVVTVATNQIQAMHDLAKHRYMQYLGHFDGVTRDDIARELNYLSDNPDLVREYSQRSVALVDGLGARRCVDAMEEDYSVN